HGAIDTVIVCDTDMQGRFFGKRLTARHFLKTGLEGIDTCSVVLGWGQDHSLDPGYTFTGWETGYPNMTVVPDLDTLRPYAWFPKTVIVLGNSISSNGLPVEISPRAILKAQLQKAEAIGLSPFAASELEFYLLKETVDTVYEKGFVNLQPKHHVMHPETVLRTSEDEEFSSQLRTALEASGVAVELVKAEYSPGQMEVNLEYADALESADRHVLLKAAVKEIALQQGLVSTFMAKWRHDLGGSSCHVHLSMIGSDHRSAFDDGQGGMSDRLRYFLGGMLKYSRDFFLFFAPNINSYRRLKPNTFAPSQFNWGTDNRTVAFRVVGNGRNKRIENRIPGADVNPYLVYAGMLAAGLYGIEHQVELESPAMTGNAYGQASKPIPKHLAEATERFENSPIVSATLGEAVQQHYANYGYQTLAAAENYVTDYERKRLLLDI
ncbi:MAG: glutamine synthetase family protein, partial [Cyanobacteria bacterium P01_A01_bin.37]